MSKDKNQEKRSSELSDEMLDNVSGGNDIKIHEVIHKNYKGETVWIERTTEEYTNKGRFISSKTERIYY